MLTAATTAVTGLAAITLHAGVAFGEQGTLSEFPSAIDGGAGGAPLTLAAGAEGQMWATESGGKIVRFSGDGGVTGEFAAATGHSSQEPEASHPDGLAVAEDGSVWFTDSGTDAEGHAFIGKISSAPPYRVSEFRIPSDRLAPESIAEGSDGNLWFTESDPTEAGEGAIGRITPEGSITEFPVPIGGANASRSNPQAIVLGSDGDMWFTDDGVFAFGYMGMVSRITPQGKFTEFGAGGDWKFPIAIALGADGNIWFTETERNVARVTPEGEPIETFFPGALPGESHRSLALGPDGDLWLAGSGSANSITRISPTGGMTEFAPILTDGGYPNAIAFDRSGRLWFGESEASKIWRWNTPRVAENESPPEISGATVEGQTVIASTGSWALDPGSFRFQWQSCSAAGAECGDLAGETSSEHFVTAADVGHTLRAVVTAVSLGGSASATSSASALVAPAPQQVVAAQLPTKIDPVAPATPVVDATMTWRFAWSTSYTLVKSLVVHSIPGGGTVSVRCSGRGCPFRTRTARPSRIARCVGTCQARSGRGKRGSIDSVDLSAWFAGRRLAPATRLTVQVTKPGWIGRSFRFVARAGHPPRVAIECSDAVSKDQGGGC